MTVDLGGVPAHCRESAEHVFAEGDVGAAVDRDLVVVVQVDQSSELQVPGERGGLAAHPLHEVAVGDEPVGVMVHEVGPEPGPEVALRDRHPNSRGEPLTQGAGGHLDTDVVVDLGVSCRVAAPLPEVPEVVEGQWEAAEVEEGVEEHRPVSVR